jgi:hypothetical protein
MNISVLGNIDTHIVFEEKDQTRSQIINTLSFLNVTRVEKSPWDLDHVRAINLSDIPNNVEETDLYAVYFYSSNVKLMLLLTDRYTELKLVHRPQVSIEDRLIKPIRGLFNTASLIVVGYETEFYIDELEISLKRMVNDPSLYPIYIRGCANTLSGYGDFSSYKRITKNPNGIAEKVIEDHIKLLDPSVI